MTNGLDVLGANDRVENINDHRWSALAAIAGAVVGGLCWREHWFFGALGGFVMGNDVRREALNIVGVARGVL